jgi:eukaryotic-like serine/threonine-protein kinase
MTLAAGARLGSYEIIAPIGVGGMGEVYRARDTTLNRDVALKVLPQAFTLDPDRLARFKREAQVLAVLNHPHIAAIYGFEPSDDVPALVLELVDGPTLADRIARGPMPIDEVLPIARQIAEALEGAHEQGIMHRDVKPANIKLRPDGTVKVLDFGLAKAFEPGPVASDLSNSPAITSPAMTRLGVILGTAAYMSPEQATGGAIDKRSDIWAFGCVLYEMLAGTRAFDGENVSETLAAVLRAEPDWAALPGDTPASIRRLLRRALEKDRGNRLPDMADARLEIDDAAREPSAVAGASPSISRRREAAWAAAVVALLLTSVALGVRVFFAPAAPAPAVRFDVVPPEGVTLPILSFPQLSPDGRKLAFVGTLRSQSRIWVRSLDAPIVQPLPGTEGAQPRPIFWSADSQFIGFVDAHGNLKRVSAAGGPPQVISKRAQRDGTWNADGVILLGGSGALQRVAASGGSPTPETELDASRQETTHEVPNFLPDGQHYLFLARSRAPSGSEERAVYVGTLGAKARHRLPGLAAEAKYSPTGHVLFLRDTTLMAQPFDLHRLALSGEAFPITEQAFFGGFAPFSVALNGSLAYRANALSATELGWFDRKGTQLAVVAPADVYQGLALSQDDRFVAFSRGTLSSNTDVWVLDLQKGRTTRLTSNPGNFNPIWSPDGRTIVFASTREGWVSLYQHVVGAVGEDTLLLQMPDALFMLPWSWSRDGRYLAFETISRERGRTFWALPLLGERKPLRIIELTGPAVAAGVFRADISTDGRWIAYQSNESGQDEVVIQSFPEPGLKQQVSTAGGAQPCWSRDGKELFYVAPNGKLMSVAITPGRSALELSASRPLFQTRLLNAAGGTSGKKYDVSADGHFLMSVATDRPGEPTTPLTVVLNWFTPFRK